jgi:hypothetical protein
MNCKIRKQNSDGIVRLETSGSVKEVLINEDFLHPNNESISLCFSGKNSSGIIDLSTKEVEILLDAVRKRNHVIKGIKIIKGN